jgi:hypothetical protein
MKNNTLAMFATISLVVSLGLLISYVDPVVCAGSQLADISLCTESASAHIWGIFGSLAFGVITLVGGTVRARLLERKERLERAELLTIQQSKF